MHPSRPSHSIFTGAASPSPARGHDAPPRPPPQRTPAPRQWPPAPSSDHRSAPTTPGAPGTAGTGVPGVPAVTPGTGVAASGDLPAGTQRAFPIDGAGTKRPFPIDGARGPDHKRRCRPFGPLPAVAAPPDSGPLGLPTSPLFFSNSRRKRPLLPARFSSSEAAAKMLSKTHGEESAVKTVTLARGTFSGFSGLSPPPAPSTRGSDQLDPFKVLGSVGIVELLENDPRPTFIVDIAEASNYTPGSASLHILFANNALRSNPSTWALVAGDSSADVPAGETCRASTQFKSWLLSTGLRGESIDANPPPVEHGGVVWSCYTLRRRLRVVSGAVLAVVPPDIPSTSSPITIAMPWSSTTQPTRNAFHAPSSSANAPVEQDYFGSSVPTHAELQTTTKSTSAPEARDNSPGHLKAEQAHGAPDTLITEDWDSDVHSPHDHDVGFFDWTRLSLSASLPRHVYFARSIDWASTPLGPIELWTNDLRAMCNLIMASPHPAAMYWGDELVAVYNEAYIGLAGQKHPKLMGQSYKEAWSEIWDDVKDVFANARLTGQATMKDDDCLFMKRNGFLEETYFSWSIIPMVGEDGTVMGLYNPAFEKTRRKIAERRMITLREVGERTATARDVKAFWGQVLLALTENEYDTPFVMLYSVSDDNDSETASLHSSSLLGNKTCYLEGSLGVPRDHLAAPEQMDLKFGNEGFGPVFREVMKTDRPVVLGIGSGDLPLEMLDGLEWRGFGDPCRDVVVCPIHPTTGDSILGFLVVGVNPRRPFDDDYNLFIQLLSRQLGTSLASVVLFEEEIRRGQKAAKLAAEDRFNLSEQLAARTQEAKESETRFTRMAEYSPAGLFIADHDGRITYCNEAWYEITRVPKEPRKTDRWIDYVKEEDQWIIQEHWKGLVENADAINIEFRFKTPWEDRSGNKGDTWVLFSAYPETHQGGTLKSIFGSLTNITPQKWAEDFQKRKMEEAVEMKRQQENFIDITSHEMRNPLSAILQCADEIATILSDFRASSQTIIPETVVADSIDAAQTIALCALHQKRIVDDVLTLSKLDSAMLKVTPVDAQPLQVVQRALKMFEGEVQTAGIEMQFVVDDSFRDLGIDWVRIDPSRVLQVLINLTTNAIKFTTPEIKRTIKVILSASRQRPSASKTPTVSFFPSRSKHVDQTFGPDWGDGDVIFLEFAVRDTGRGLTDEEKKLLFQRFSQASPRTHVQYGGSGLGLFISRELTELQGGEIGVSSEAGKGSTFAFYVRCRKSVKPPKTNESLPIALGQRSRKTASRYKDYTMVSHGAVMDPSKEPKAHLHVLIVEDNLVNQKVLQRQLHNQSIVTYVANHGGEALEKLKESWYWKANGPDALGINVVLMDKEMPVMDGLECTRQIREWEEQGLLRSHVPIIAVTANARSEQIATLLAAGMDDVVSKPFRISELVPKIEGLAIAYPTTQQDTNNSIRAVSGNIGPST